MGGCCMVSAPSGQTSRFPTARTPPLTEPRWSIRCASSECDAEDRCVPLRTVVHQPQLQVRFLPGGLPPGPGHPVILSSSARLQSRAGAFFARATDAMQRTGVPHGRALRHATARTPEQAPGERPEWECAMGRMRPGDGQHASALPVRKRRGSDWAKDARSRANSRPARQKRKALSPGSAHPSARPAAAALPPGAGCRHRAAGCARRSASPPARTAGSARQVQRRGAAWALPARR